MTFSNTKSKKFLTPIFMVIFAGCSAGTIPGTAPETKPKSSENQSTAGEDPTNLTARMGVSMYKTARYSMSRSLGVDPKVCDTVYNSIKSLLPQVSETNALTSTNMNSLADLSLCYCENSLNNNATATTVLPGIDLSSATTLADAAKRDQVSKRFVYLAWGEDADKLSKGSEIVSELSGLQKDIMDMENTAANKSKRAALAACMTAFAALGSSLL